MKSFAIMFSKTILLVVLLEMNSSALANEDEEDLVWMLRPDAETCTVQQCDMYVCPTSNCTCKMTGIRSSLAMNTGCIFRGGTVTIVHQPSKTSHSLIEVSIDCRIVEVTMGDIINDILVPFEKQQGVHSLKICFNHKDMSSQWTPISFPKLHSLEIKFITENWTNLPFYNTLALTFPNLTNLVIWNAKVNTSIKELLLLYPNLSSIRLSNCKFSSDVFDEGFSTLSSLVKLYFTGNSIEMFSSRILASLNSTEELDFSENGIALVAEDAFVSTAQLKSINLSKNKLSLLPALLFRELIHLRYLNLSHNSLKNLPTNLLQNIDLVDLDLSFNRLLMLPGNFLNNIRFLNFLDLSHNFLSEIPLCLKTLTFIKTLDLGNNNITEIELPGLENHIPNVGSLSLSNNCLTSFPLSYELSFRDSHIVVDLLLTNCCLVDFPTTLAKNAMRTLDLRYNHIQYVDNFILAEASHLNGIDLGHNEISTVNVTFEFPLFKNSSYPENPVTLVNLHENPLLCDCRLFNFLQFLNFGDSYRSNRTRLTFWPQNLICTGPKEMANEFLYNIKAEDLTCLITEDCPPACECYYNKYHNLTTVNCSQRNLNSFPKNLPKLGNINLHLDHNNISSLPDSHWTLWKFIYGLYLDHNKLQSVKSISTAVDLRVIHLTNNKLQKIDESLNFLIMDDLKRYVYLSGNPWRCDCNLLQSLLNGKMIVDKMEIECKDGREQLNARTMASWLCNRLTVGQVFLILVGLVAVFLLIVYALFPKIRNTLYLRGYCLSWILDYHRAPTEERCFDAYVVCADQQYDWYINDFLPQLTETRLHLRVNSNLNRSLGEAVFSTSGYFISHSRKVIIVLTPEFIEDELCVAEFSYAVDQNIRDGVNHTIIVTLDNLPDRESLARELYRYISSNVILPWGSRNFWPILEFYFRNT